MKLFVRPGLFAISNEPDTLREVCKNFAVWDLFASWGRAQYVPLPFLEKIEITSMTNATNVSHYYDITKQMVFELTVKVNKQNYRNNSNCNASDLISTKIVMDQSWLSLTGRFFHVLTGSNSLTPRCNRFVRRDPCLYNCKIYNIKIKLHI